MASLQDITGVDMGEPDWQSYPAIKCHQLWAAPLESWQTEDYRVMVEQKIGLEHVVPRALEILEQNPFAEGDCFPGDLLSAVTRVPQGYWQEHPAQLPRIQALIARALESVDTLDEVDEECFAQAFSWIPDYLTSNR